MPPHVINKIMKNAQLLRKAHSNLELLRKCRTSGRQRRHAANKFSTDDPLLEQIRDEIPKTDVNTLTPEEALFKLNEIKTLLRK